jgi:Rrf2 family protein
VISKSGIYAVQAVRVLAQLPPAEFVRTGWIAERIDAPVSYLGKLLQALVHDGLVESQRGVGGGFRLAVPPERITVYDVIEPIDHPSRWTGCLLRQSACSEDSPCTVHPTWQRIKHELLTLLRRTSITDLSVDDVIGQAAQSAT